MSYQHIEEIQSRKGEKIALFLTLENAMGLVLSAFPAYLITASLPSLLRILIVFVAGALGVVLTLDVGGMTSYERLIWRIRGVVRLRVQPALIQPEHLAGAVVTVRRNRPLAVGGPVQLRPLPVARFVQPRSSQPNVRYHEQHTLGETGATDPKLAVGNGHTHADL